MTREGKTVNQTRVPNSFDGEAVAEELPPLLLVVEAAIRRRPVDLRELRAAMDALLAFLSSPAGRTNANCRATDLFLSISDLEESEWEHLPEPLRAILWDMGAQLHDTFGAPDIAANFESTPEQLLARLRAAGSADGDTG